MKHRGMRAIVEWAPRECNREADMLANGDSSLFDPERRIPVAAGILVWNVLPEALKAGRDAEETYKRLKETHGLPNRSAKQRKRAAEHRLKFKDPWERAPSIHLHHSLMFTFGLCCILGFPLIRSSRLFPFSSALRVSLVSRY